MLRPGSSRNDVFCDENEHLHGQSDARHLGRPGSDCSSGGVVHLRHQQERNRHQRRTRPGESCSGPPGRPGLRWSRRSTGRSPSATCANLTRSPTRRPRTPDRSVRRSVPSIANPTTKDRTRHTANTGLPNSLGGLGWPQRRDPPATRRASATAAPINSDNGRWAPGVEWFPPQLVAMIKAVVAGDDQDPRWSMTGLGGRANTGTAVAARHDQETGI